MLVGNGEYHYRLIESLKTDNPAARPILIVSEENKGFANTLGPAHAAGLTSKDAVLLDTWSLCQRKGVYFLRDQCVDMSFEDRTLYLKKYGKLKFHKTSFEFATEPNVFSSQLRDNPSILRYREGFQFYLELKRFFKEVHLHCPREIRVVFSGLSRETVEYATIIQKELQKCCPHLEVQILYGCEESEGGPSQLKKLKKRLVPQKIYLRQGLVEKVDEHCLTLSDGSQVEFDIFIPMHSWRVQDVVGRHLQSEDQSLLVGADLALRDQEPVFAVGAHVGVNLENRTDLDRYDLSLVVDVLKKQLFSDGACASCLQDVSPLKRIWQSPALASNWLGHPLDEKEVKTLWSEQILSSKMKTNLEAGPDLVQKGFQESLSFEANHMSRPWSGLTKRGPSETDYQLQSVSGFNWWGSFAESATRICELTILKSLTTGVFSTHMRFSLSLPRATPALHQHIFESTLKAIESVCEKYDVDLDGGHTFDGDHWQLHITTGGVKAFQVATRFRPHDYLILTRPLGYGPLWTSRLSPHFNSRWVEQEVNSPILADPFALQSFVIDFDVSAMVLVEEWGLLYHCIQQLPGKAQMMVNFREVPRWPGVDTVIGQAPLHPSSEHNWQRVMRHVPFQQEEVSLSNRVLWDPLSQGALVIGVSADSYSEALCNLCQMGYTHANLIGCVRPQVKGYKVVLSDWKPR